jgi:type I restriction enzyme R subunit
MDHELMSAGVLSKVEMEAGVAALLSGDVRLQPVLYANLGPAVGRFLALGDEARRRSAGGWSTSAARMPSSRR